MACFPGTALARCRSTQQKTTRHSSKERNEEKYMIEEIFSIANQGRGMFTVGHSDPDQTESPPPKAKKRKLPSRAEQGKAKAKQKAQSSQRREEKMAKAKTPYRRRTIHNRAGVNH